MADVPVANKPITLRDYRIGDMSLIAANGVAIDIRALVVELIVRQDIFTNYMHGECIIVDGIDAFTASGLHGDEYLFLDLYEPAVDTRIRKAFRVFKVTDRTTSGANMQRYKLHFTSEEMFTSNVKLVSRAYKGATISSIAKDIITRYLSTDKYYIEDTDLSTDIIVSNMRPTQALNWLAARATNGDKNSYLYYENLDGLNFKSLHSIYGEEPINSEAIRFEAKIVQADMMRNKYNIDKFSAIRDFDVLTLSANGGVCMRMLGIDPFHRTFRTNDYDMGSARKLNDTPALFNMVGSDGISIYENYESNQIAYVQTDDTSTEKGNNSDKWISRKLHLAMVRNSLVDVVLPGNMLLQAGKLANVEMPMMIPATEQNMVNETRSGKYLIVGVAHKFNLVDFKFDTIVTLSRDSYPVLKVSPDSSLPQKMRKLNG